MEEQLNIVPIPTGLLQRGKEFLVEDENGIHRLRVDRRSRRDGIKVHYEGPCASELVSGHLVDIPLVENLREAPVLRVPYIKIATVMLGTIIIGPIKDLAIG